MPLELLVAVVKLIVLLDPPPKKKRIRKCSVLRESQNNTTMHLRSVRTSGFRKLIYLGTCYRHYLRITYVYSL